jgi:hypothetical protein
MSFVLFAGDATHIDGNVQPFIDFCQTLGPLFPSHIFPVYGNHDGPEDGLAQDETTLRNTFPALGTFIHQHRLNFCLQKQNWKKHLLTQI